jgi:sugar phosphate isomerase/epimerase
MVLPFSLMFTMEDVLKTADLCNKLGKKCSEKGMKFYYHNHSQEFIKIGDKFALELLLENTNPEYVSIELDTYWVARAGLDPIEMIKKLGSRCKIIHQKDLSSKADPVNLFDLMQGTINAETVMGAMMNGAKETDIVEVGTGILDIEEIYKTAAELDYAQYIIVELDFTHNMPVFESIALSLKNLQSAIDRD